VILVSRSRDKLEDLRSEIKSAGGRAEVFPCDLAKMEAIDAMAAAVLKKHGRVDILVNNAGRSIRRSVHESLDRFHDFQRTMQLNYFGAVRLLLLVLPGMKERQHGHVINISSIGVQAYPPRFGAYVASKSALAALSRCLGPEVADDGIAVTNIHMPVVRTPMIAPTGIYKSFPTISPEEAAEMVLSAVLTRNPEVSTRLGKLGETVDVVAPTPPRDDGGLPRLPGLPGWRGEEGEGEAGPGGDLAGGGGDGLLNEGDSLLRVGDLRAWPDPGSRGRRR